jgi:protein-tyrosine phosphatase
VSEQRRPSFDVAFVCTGNRFRSPLAAALLSAATAGLSVNTSSVGVLELGPAPALPEAVGLARTFDVDLAAHRARCLADVDLEQFDLVLAFERMHVRAAVVDAGASIDRTFTLPELVALLEALPEPAAQSDPLERARSRLGQAHASRPPQFRTGRTPEIADPLGRAPHEQRKTAEEVHALIRRLTQLLFD